MICQNIGKNGERSSKKKGKTPRKRIESSSDEDDDETRTNTMRTKPKYKNKQERMSSHKKKIRRSQTLKDMDGDTSYISPASDEESYFN